MASHEVMEILITASHPHHGCMRETPKGEKFIGCGSQSCPDCVTANYLQDLIRAGANVASATITHDPSGNKIVDSFDYGYAAKRDPSKMRVERTRNQKWPK